MVGRNPASNFKESKKINPFPTIKVIYEVRLFNPAGVSLSVFRCLSAMTL